MRSTADSSPRSTPTIPIARRAPCESRIVHPRQSNSTSSAGQLRWELSPPRPSLCGLGSRRLRPVHASQWYNVAACSQRSGHLSSLPLCSRLPEPGCAHRVPAESNRAESLRVAPTIWLCALLPRPRSNAAIPIIDWSGSLSCTATSGSVDTHWRALPSVRLGPAQEARTILTSFCGRMPREICLWPLRLRSRSRLRGGWPRSVGAGRVVGRSRAFFTLRPIPSSGRLSEPSRRRGQVTGSWLFR